MAEKMTIARPYAKAVFECATEAKTIPEWANALSVLALISKNEHVLRLLRDDAVSTKDIAKLFLEVCQESLNTRLGELLHNFILLLSQKKRLKTLPEIALQYKQMQLDSENRAEVKFKSSIPINADEQKNYEEILENYLSRKVTLHCEIDTTLLGGFLAKSANIVIDGSILGSLTNLKTAMGD